MIPADIQDGVGRLRLMMLIREFERVSLAMSARGKIPGGMHSAAGQEAVAVGVIASLEQGDVVASSHRSHHVALAMGLTAESVMAELYGKADGCCGGRGGHMHLADFSGGLFGSNGIVGGGLGIALGAAFASKTLKRQQLAVGFFGDGGLNTGRVWEFINLAALWGLPLLAVCENNQYAVETHLSRAMAGGSVVERAQGFGITTVSVDGQDVDAVREAATAARARALNGGGPTFLECVTYRFEGHNTGDVQNYRTKDEVADWMDKRDPLRILSERLVDSGAIREDDLARLYDESAEAVGAAVAAAEASPWPERPAQRGVTSLQDLFGEKH